MLNRSYSICNFCKSCTFRVFQRSFILNTLFVFQLGERGSGFRKQTDVQDFYKIRDECLAEGRLWEDPEFEAVDSSIFFSRTSPRRFEWKRPNVRSS